MDEQHRIHADGPTCRALVPVEAARGRYAGSGAPRPDACFLALLVAHRLGAEATRERRRAPPGAAILAYSRGASLGSEEHPAALAPRTI